MSNLIPYFIDLFASSNEADPGNSGAQKGNLQLQILGCEPVAETIGEMKRRADGSAKMPAQRRYIFPVEFAPFSIDFEDVDGKNTMDHLVTLEYMLTLPYLQINRIAYPIYESTSFPIANQIHTFPMRVTWRGDEESRSNNAENGEMELSLVFEKYYPEFLSAPTPYTGYSAEDDFSIPSLGGS